MDERNLKLMREAENKPLQQHDVSGCKICPDCEGQMQSYDVPVEKVFKIPFTGWELILRNWNGKEWYCYDCVRDRQQDKFNDAFNAGVEEGMNRGYREAMRERGKFY